MKDHLPLLILIAPLLAAPFALVADFFSAFLARALAAAGLLAGLEWGFQSFPRLLSAGRWHYNLGGWAPPWGIELVAGPFSTTFACLILGISLLSLVYAWQSAGE